MKRKEGFMGGKTSVGGQSVILSIVIFTFIFAFSQILWAEAKYPTQPVKLVVTYATGGSTDIAARALAGPIQEFLGQPLVVVNIPGAGGAVGFDDIRKSPPDGYRMMMAAIGANVLMPALNPKLHFKYDELVFVARTQINPNVLVINAKSAWKNFKEFAEAVKNNPRKFKFSTAGVAQITHVGPLFVLKDIGVQSSDVSTVHFDSDSEAILAVVRGDTDFCQVNLSSAVASLKGGLVRCLAVTTAERVENLKDVPTYKELGHPKINIVGWRGICGPPGLPAHVVKTWEEAVYKTCKSQSWLKVVEPLGDIPGYMNAKEFTSFVHEEFKRYRETFTATGLLIK